MRPLPILGPLLLAACHETIVLTPPSDPRWASALLIVEAGEAPIVFASSVTGGGFDPPLPPLALVAETRVFATGFACPLSVLGLAPGGQVLTAADRPLFARPLGVQALDVASASWVPAADLSPVTRTLARLEWTSRCSIAPRVAVRGQTELVRGSHDLDFAIYTGGRVLAGITLDLEAKTSLWSIDDPIESTETGTRAVAAAALPDGGAIFIGRLGTIFEASPADLLAPERWRRRDVPFSDGSSRPVGMKIDLRLDGGRPIILGAAGSGDIDYFDGDVWSSLLPASPASRATSIVALQRAHDGGHIVLGLGRRPIRIDAQRNLHFEDLDSGSECPYSSVLERPERGDAWFGRCAAVDVDSEGRITNHSLSLLDAVLTPELDHQVHRLERTTLGVLAYGGHGSSTIDELAGECPGSAEDFGEAFVKEYVEARELVAFYKSVLCLGLCFGAVERVDPEVPPCLLVEP